MPPTHRHSWATPLRHLSITLIASLSLSPTLIPPATAVSLTRQTTLWRQVLVIADNAIAQGDYDTALINLRRAKQFTSDSCDIRFVNLLMRAAEETKLVVPQRDTPEAIGAAYDYFFNTRLALLEQTRFFQACPTHTP